MEQVSIDDIRFSQSDVSGSSRKLSRNWDTKKFTGADVVRFGENHFVSLDNRRVFRAKHARAADGALLRLHFRVHLPTEPIDPAVALDKYGLLIAWTVESDVFSGIVYPCTWGAAARSRCASQHIPPFLSAGFEEGAVLEQQTNVSSFPLEGSVEFPSCLDDHKHPPSDKALRPVYVLTHGQRSMISETEALESLKQAQHVYVSPRFFTHDLRAVRTADFIAELVDVQNFSWDAASISRQGKFLLQAAADQDLFDDADSDSEV